jgi:nitrogen-specific signal transduction histidine kinase/CheY-like chemotaxis protein
VQRDISEQLRLTAQLQQSQKMEAVGMLAGGVAHDYNNMLSVILGYTELALDTVGPAQQPLHGYLLEILKATGRSTEITRQLLAFARKQTITPVVLDLNRNVESMLKMLRQLIGEEIELVWLPEKGLHPIKMDPVQVDQILANLCVNARDAIAGVGKVTIATSNAVLDVTNCVHQAGFVAGEYVLLVVTDDGCGMDKEIIDQIFEPFFSSKGVGKGTGLGLSTVYGIVQQNHGFINVFSEPGKGTSFRIYLPRYAGQVVDALPPRDEKVPRGHGETVLVVEDEPALLEMGVMVLEKLGYRVLSAATPGRAIALAEKHGHEIHLLLTDIVMPEMNGRQLADRVHAICPTIKTLFMSGHTVDVIAHRGVLDEGVNFIQKPFSLKDMAVKVQEALSEESVAPRKIDIPAP